MCLKKRFETFTVLLNRISRNIRKLKNREMAEYNLRSAHISCLYYLYLSEGLTATELCERCEEDKATVSRALEYLETNGYLTCETQSAKRYKSPLVLTEKGVEVGERIAEKINKILFMFNSKLASISELQKEYGNKKEEQIMLFEELDPDVAGLGCAS